GGAQGVRANSTADIVAIKQEVSLTVVGIVKRNYADSAVFITDTKKEEDELLESGCEIIAMEATRNKRPTGTLEELVAYIRETAPQVELMADCSTVKEAKTAEELGFDYIGTTLYGYTEETK